MHRWDAEHDVVIVGFGAAGACAAIEAASAGADTLIVERASSYGGTSALSGGEIYLGGSGGTPRSGRPVLPTTPRICTAT